MKKVVGDRKPGKWTEFGRLVLKITYNGYYGDKKTTKSKA